MTEEAKKFLELIRYIGEKNIGKRGKPPHIDTFGDLYIEDMFAKAADLIESLSAQLEQVTRERDALLDELKGECDVCANRKDCTAPKCRKSQHKECEECPCRTCIIDTNWKWEGVEVE